LLRAYCVIDFNKNDRIDTPKEWEALLGGIADDYTKGNITYDTAKKYVDLSSNTSFVKNNKLNNAYKEGFIQGLEHVKEKNSFSLFRKKEKINPGEILKYANSAKDDEERKEYEERGLSATEISYRFRAYEPTKIEVGMKFGDYLSVKKEQEEHAKANKGKVIEIRRGVLSEKNVYGCLISELYKNNKYGVSCQKLTKDGVWLQYRGRNNDGKFTKIYDPINKIMAEDKNKNGIVDKDEITRYEKLTEY
jgi:hypothetical protein